MSDPVNVLLVDDDPSVRQMICDYLEEQNFRVLAVADASAFRAAVAVGVELPDIVLLDVNLPDEDGLSLVRFLRERHDLPVLMISGAGSVVDRVVGLEVGADDYLVKPFEPRELVARIRTILRRYRREATEPAQETRRTVRLGHCLLDLDQRLLLNGQQEEIPLRGVPYQPLKFVTPAPYRIVRHPLYVGWLIVFWATPTMTLTHLLFAVVTNLYIVVAIQFEEHDLIDAHPEYRDYRKTVPMLLPRFGLFRARVQVRRNMLP